MTDTEKIFISLLCGHFNESATVSCDGIDEEILQRLCFEHKVTPLIFDSAVRNKATLSDVFLSELKKTAYTETVMQLRRNSAFLSLYRRLSEVGQIITVKGIVIGSLYPNPDMRLTSDYDLLIKEEEFDKIASFLTEDGFECNDLEKKSHEHTFFNRTTGVKLELHTSLFESDEKNCFNSLLADPFNNTGTKLIEGCHVLTLSDTFHMLYLILHSLKHFYRSGFGVRQLCDFAVFSSSAGERIDKEFIMNALKTVNADRFTDVMAGLSVKYLGFDREKILYCNRIDEDDTEDILLDIIDGGIYGTSSEERVHSSVLTNTEVYSNSKASGLSLIFPPAEVMKRQYGYVEKHRYLLPVAWLQRICKKSVSALSAKSDSGYSTAVKSIELGKKRIEMMKKHGIIIPDNSNEK